jgi:hypothetical protein
MTRRAIARQSGPTVVALACAGMLAAACGSDPVSPSNNRIAGIYALEVITGCSALPADVQTRR